MKGQIPVAFLFLTENYFSTPLTILAPILSGAYPDLEERALDVFDQLIAMQGRGVDDYLWDIERI